VRPFQARQDGLWLPCLAAAVGLRRVQFQVLTAMGGNFCGAAAFECGFFRFMLLLNAAIF